MVGKTGLRGCNEVLRHAKLAAATYVSVRGKEKRCKPCEVTTVGMLEVSVRR